LSRPGRPILKQRPILARLQARLPRRPQTLEMLPAPARTHDGRRAKAATAATTLGSCIASCLGDHAAQVAGMRRLHMGERAVARHVVKAGAIDLF
jgi:hypothetical protein